MYKFKVYFWRDLPRGLFKNLKLKYKNRLKDYMNVYICNTFNEMYDLEDKLEGTKVERNYGGRTWCYSHIFRDFESGEYVKTGPLCGHIALTEEYFYSGDISHECTHAVIGYFSRKLIDEQKMFENIDKNGNIIENEYNIAENEELMCYMIGNLTNQIIINYEKQKEQE